MAKIYVGCALKHAPEEFRGMVENIKSRLRAEGHEVFEFIGLDAGTAADVYEHDIHYCVARCEVMIGLCDFPSLGLGWELGMAVEVLKKPTLTLAHRDSKISRLPIGAESQRNPRYRFSRYEDADHAVMLALDFLRELSKS